MITRVAQRKRPRWSALLAISTVAAVSSGLFATTALALVTDGTASNQCDIQVANKTEADVCTTDGGAIVRYIGDSNTTFGSSGTGTFNPFVRLQASPSQRGYNTDGTLQFDSKAGKWTHAIKVSEIPVVPEGGIPYWELWVDINEGNSSKPVQLTEVEIFFTGSATLTGYTTPTWTGADKVYDFLGSILINDVNQGSGRGDLRYLVPTADRGIPANCNYGNASCSTYFVLYSQWGAAAGNAFVSDGGFEEWKVKIYPVTSTATQLKRTSNDANITDGASVAVGTGVYDTATLSGANIASAGGTVSYYSQAQTVNDVSPNCTAGTLVGSAVNVTNGVVPASASVTLSSTGTYEFWAVYSGDANNLGSTSTCGSETVVVTPNTTTTATQVKNTLGTASVADDTNIADGGSVAIGTVVYDTATLSGNTASAGGTVSYYRQKQTINDTNPNCTGGTIIGSAVTVASGVVPASATLTLTSAGTYEFWAVYSGDGNNNGSTSVCGSETVVVSPNTNGISTAQSLVPNDSATLTGLTSDATGTITFKLFPPSNSTCSAGGTAPVVNQALTVTGNQGSPYSTTNTTAVSAEGTYRWLVVYSGDANNSGATSACGVEIYTIDNDTTTP